MSKDEFILMLGEIRISENTIGPLFGAGWAAAVDYISQRMKTELDAAPAPHPDTLEESWSDARGVIEALLEECRSGTSCRLGDRIEDGEQWLRAVHSIAESLPTPVEAKPHPDKELFDYWFGPQIKHFDISEYLRGVSEGWTADQWRAFIDAARKASEPEEETWK